jgi:zinc protease
MPVRRVLSNGMTVILQENRTAPVVSIQVWVKAGSKQETDREAGIAHVHEHMLFKGTQKRGVGEIAREAEAAGGEINAYTSWDMTVYFVNMASRFKDRGIDILADIIENAAFDSEELRRELEVIREEIRRSKDIPTARLSEAFYAAAFSTHPYGRPVIGYDEVVRGFTRQDVLRFYQKWYVPENLVWVMVGDLDAQALLPELEARLSRIPNRPVPLQARTEEPPQSEPRVVLLEEDAKEAALQIGFHIPGISHPDVPALDLLAQVLGQGRSSRLYSSLRMQRHLVNSISAYSMTPRDPGLFIVSAGLEAPDTDQALTGMLQETFRMRFEPVSAEELKKAKTQLHSDFIYQQQTVQGQARELGTYEAIVGDLGFGEQYLARLQSVGAEDILRVARTYLHPDNLTLGALVPKKASEGVSKKRLLKLVTRTYKSMEDRFEEKAGETHGPEGAVLEVRLPNGAILLVKENRAVPLVSLQVAFLGGLLSENPNDNGISNFVARMLNKGTETRSAEAIAEEVESLAGSISGFSGRDSFGLSGETVAWNFLPLFEVFSDILLKPTFPEEYVEKTRKDVLAAIKNREDRLDSLAFLLLWKTLYPCHPYGMDILGTRKSVKGLNREDLLAYYRKHAVSRNVVLTIVGDIDSMQAKKEAEELLMSLPDEPFVRSIEACDAAPERKAAQQVSAEKQQAHLLVGARGARHSDRDKYSLDVLHAVLSGQGGRLFTELRDQQSLAYSVTALHREAVHEGLFALYMATSPDKRETATDGMLEQIRRIREQGISDEELERAKNFLIGTYEVGIQTNSAQASAMAFNELYGLGYAEYLEYPQRIAEVTAKDVKEAAKKYLCADCLSMAEIIPINK